MAGNFARPQSFIEAEYRGYRTAKGPIVDLLGEEFDPDDYDLGAELLEDMIDDPDGNAGCYDGLEFIGDVGRDPIGVAND